MRRKSEKDIAPLNYSQMHEHMKSAERIFWVLCKE